MYPSWINTTASSLDMNEHSQFQWPIKYIDENIEEMRARLFL